MRLKALLWRIVYVVLCFLILWIVGPLFLDFIGIPIPANAQALLRVCLGLIALLYVIFGPDPPALF